MSDFGLSREVEGVDGEYRSSGRGVMPLRWTAPEALESRQFSTASDVWAFGVLPTEIISYGRKPYQGLTNKEVVTQLEKGFRMPQMPGCPDGLYRLMLECWRTVRAGLGVWLCVEAALLTLPSRSRVRPRPTQVPQERPSFLSLTHRLEDFFASGEANYAEVVRAGADE